MAQPLPKPNQPLLDVLGQIAITEKEMAAILRDGAEEAERIIPKLIEQNTTGGRVKAAQLSLIKREIRAMQSALWGDLGATLREGVTSTALLPSQAEDVLFSYLRKNGVDPARMKESLLATAKQGIPAVLAKAYNRIPLSRQVYRTQALASGLVDRKVSVGLLLGHNAKRIAKSVKDLILPNVAGGVSYAAFRLARTEINHAYKTAQENRHAGEPWTQGMRWNLSDSHPTPDICNLLAARDNYGLGPGVYPIGQRPDSHPNCLCYLTPEQDDEDEFINSFVAGRYDDYLDQKMGLSREVARIRPPAAPVESVPLVGEAAHHIVPKGLYKKGTMSRSQREALKTYESGWFAVINGFLRGNRWGEPDYVEEERDVTRIDSAMAESVLPAPIQAWRGLFKANRVFGDRMVGDLTGFSWHELGYGSVSTSEKIVRMFTTGSPDPAAAPVAGSALLKIYISAGVRALQTSTSTRGSKANGPQAEITLQHDLVWKVVRDNGVDEEGVRQLEVEVDVKRG